MNKSITTLLVCMGILFAGFPACASQGEVAILTNTPETTTDFREDEEGVTPKRGGTLVFSFCLGNPVQFNPALHSGSATIIPGAQIFASP
jgi:hypothetical protein